MLGEEDVVGLTEGEVPELPVIIFAVLPSLMTANISPLPKS